jgi:hypothetical protein
MPRELRSVVERKSRCINLRIPLLHRIYGLSSNQIVLLLKQIVYDTVELRVELFEHRNRDGTVPGTKFEP